MSRLARAPLSLAVLALLPAVAVAQDTTRGVRIGLEYQGSGQPGVIVLPVAGPQGDSIRTILQRDLDYGDRVALIPVSGDPRDTDAFGGRAGRPLNYALVARLGAAAVVQATPVGASLHVAVHDIRRQQVLAVDDFPLGQGAYDREWRFALHGVSDQIEQWLTGTRGIAQTRIAFVRGGSLMLLDADGAGEVALSTIGAPLSPSWHPRGASVAYNTYGVESRVVVHDLVTGRNRTVSATHAGVNQTPAFSPDGGTIAYAHTPGDGGDIYLVPANGGGARRITVGRGTLNLSPTWSPDGRRIAFTSSRSGHPEVYIMDADGTNAELLTPFVFGEQSYQSNPDWSPDGRLVAYQSQVAGQFQLKTIGLRDRGTRTLTNVGRNEDPSWAADGRHLVFTSTRSGTRQLWVLDVETGRTRQLTRGGGRSASWSRRLGGAR
ncbi:MAG: hypothetical protein ACYC3Q_05490 [Gemmatimonadaceae bacterium]